MATSVNNVVLTNPSRQAQDRGTNCRVTLIPITRTMVVTSTSSMTLMEVILSNGQAHSITTVRAIGLLVRLRDLLLTIRRSMTMDALERLLAVIPLRRLPYTVGVNEDRLRYELLQFLVVTTTNYGTTNGRNGRRRNRRFLWVFRYLCLFLFVGR